MIIDKKVIDPLSTYNMALKKIEESGIIPTKTKKSFRQKILFRKRK